MTNKRETNHLYDYYTLTNEGNGIYTVHAWGRYSSSSVLAGQARKVFIESFEHLGHHEDAMAKAQAEYGDMNWSNKWTEPQVSLNHLPGEDDFVPGGAYPDDYE